MSVSKCDHFQVEDLSYCECEMKEKDDKISSLGKELAEANGKTEHAATACHQAWDRIRLQDMVISSRDREVAAKNREISRLRGALEAAQEYVRHMEGCNGTFGYPCKCGFEKARIQIERILMQSSGEKEAG